MLKEVEKIENPYIDENYVPYQDERWTSIPAVEVIGTFKLTEEDKQKAKEFEIFVNELSKTKDT